MCETLSSLAHVLSPHCLCAPEGKYRKGSVMLRGNSSTAAVALLSLSCEISPYQSPASASLPSWAVIDRMKQSGEGRLVSGPGGTGVFVGLWGWGCQLLMGSSEGKWRGSRRGQMDFSMPYRKVSDQCSWFGLVLSVPLRICQLWTQGAAEKTAVTERPVEEDRITDLQDFISETFQTLNMSKYCWACLVHFY